MFRIIISDLTRRSAIVDKKLIIWHCLEQPCSMLMMAIPDVKISMFFACL